LQNFFELNKAVQRRISDLGSDEGTLRLWENPRAATTYWKFCAELKNGDEPSPLRLYNPTPAMRSSQRRMIGANK